MYLTRNSDIILMYNNNNVIYEYIKKKKKCKYQLAFSPTSRVVVTISFLCSVIYIIIVVIIVRVYHTAANATCCP